MAQLGQGHVADSIATYEKLRTVNPRAASLATIGLADLAIYEGRTADAVKLLTDGIAADLQRNAANAAALKMDQLADAYLAAGNLSQAAQVAERAVQTDKDPLVLFQAGRVLTEAGQGARAMVIASQLEPKLDPEPRMYTKLLRGELALKAGNYAQAVELFQQAQQITDTWLGHFDLGRAYLAANKFPEANSEFDRCVQRRGEASSLFLDDNPTFRYVPAVYYYLGRTQQGMNSPAAIDSYKTFLNIRKGDDPLAADARHRLGP
jgi:tetratricopeptide (TPR) repeat protein